MDGSYSNDNTSSWFDFAQRPREQGGLGLQRHQAAGLVGNLVHESGPGIAPWGVTGDNGTAFGAAQWRNERMHGPNGLVSFATANGMDPRTTQAQQAFMRHEFDTTERRSYDALSSSQSPEEAATAVNRLYERSADNTGGRESTARALFSGQSPAPANGAVAINSAAGIPDADPAIMSFAAQDQSQPAPDQPQPISIQTPAMARPKPSPFDQPGPTYAAGPTINPQQSAPAIPPLPPGVTPISAPAAPQSAPQAAAPSIPPLPPGVVPVGAQAAQPAEPNAPFSGTRAVTQTATGFNEGLAQSVLRPLDAAANLMTKPAEWLTGQPNPNPHMVEGAFRKYFVDANGQPQNRAEGVLRAGGRMAGDNLPLLAAGAAPIRSGVTLAEQAAGGIGQKASGVVDTALDNLAAHPVAQTVGAFESGAGGEVGRNVAKDNGGGENAQRAAELAGQFLTPAALETLSTGVRVPGTSVRVPLSPTIATGKAANFVAGKAVDALPVDMLPQSLRSAPGTFAERQADNLAYSNREGKYSNPDVPAPPEPNFVQRRLDQNQVRREDNARSTVGKEFNQILEQPEASANLDEARRLEQTIPGLQLGSAKATQDPALLRLQQNIESNAKGGELRQVQQAHDDNVGAIRNYQDSIVPAAHPPEISAGQEPQDIVAAANAARVQNTSRANQQDINNTQGLIQRRSDALPEIDRAATGQTLRDIRTGEQGAADAEVNRLRANIADPNAHVPELNMTVDDALNRRGDINNEVRDIASSNARSPADMRRIRELGAERDQIDAALGNINDAGLREYTRYYRDEYAPRFLEGPSRDVGRYSQTGIDKNKVQAEDVPSRFFGPNNISEARQFNRLYGTGNAPESAAARQAMTDYALDDLRHTAVDPNTNMIREGSVNRWLQKNERLLNEMPWLRDAVEARNPDQLYQRLGELEQRQRAIGDTKVASLVGKNPEQHIDAALNDWQTMRGLKSSVRGDPQAEASLRRAVMDRAPDPMDADKFEAWLDKNDRSLRQVLDPSHLKSLRDVLAASRAVGQLPRPTGAVDMPGSMADKATAKLGISMPSLLQRVLSVKQGRMSPEYGVADVAARALRQFSNREAAAVWKEAIYNPKVARDLEVMTRGTPTAIQLARMKSYLLSVGMADAAGNDEEKPYKGSDLGPLQGERR